MTTSNEKLHLQGDFGLHKQIPVSTKQLQQNLNSRLEKQKHPAVGNGHRFAEAFISLHLISDSLNPANNFNFSQIL